MTPPFLPAPTGAIHPLADVREPELLRDQFPFSEVPRILFDGQFVVPSPPPEIWITDTTFRDGQQARAPYTPEQIVHIYDLLHRMGGPNGVIRQSEFFLYSDRDREAVRGCLALGHTYPEVTGWIRANADDFKIVRELGLKETGILTSVSDYHIFLKLKKNRAKVIEEYLAIVRTAIEQGVRPRCHFEDVTRADIYGFCIPFAEELLRISQESGVPVKIRLCDTMGYGISYPGAVLPRSIPKMLHAFRTELGYPPELLEWHGHNDFHKVHTNAVTAWLYGASALNASLLGFGERTGNPPLEGALMEYIGLMGTTNGIDTLAITEMAEYYRDEIRAEIPSNYPFVGSECNTTRAGIHADGIMKNPEIYNIFDTDRILGRPLKITVTDKSGVAGIAQWLTDYARNVMNSTEPVNKRHPGVRRIHAWVSEQYEHGRTSGISPEEMIAQARHHLPSLFESDFSKIRKEAVARAVALAGKISGNRAVQNMEPKAMEDFLTDIVKEEASIQLLAVTNTQGRRISQVHTQHGEKRLFRRLLDKDFRKHDWFVRVLESGEPYYSDLFFSKFTGILIMTAAMPVFGKDGALKAVIDIDFKFDELAKLITAIPDEILDRKVE